MVHEDALNADEEKMEDADDDTDSLEFDKVPEEQKVWFRKVKPILKHFNETTKVVCVHPSFSCSVDEMLERFQGRSFETYRMPKKPIPEGYKFYSLCCAQTGLVYMTIPYGRTSYKETIRDMVLALVDSLPDHKKRLYVVAIDNFFTYQQTVNS